MKIKIERSSIYPNRTRVSGDQGKQQPPFRSTLQVLGLFVPPNNGKQK